MTDAELIANCTKFRRALSLKVAQHDLKTGKCLRIFPNRYQAAAWVIEKGLTSYFYESIGKTRCCIAGTLTNSIKKEQNAYGYKWTLISPLAAEQPTVKYRNMSGKNRKSVHISQ